MKLVPNLGPKMRVLYALVGLGLVVLSVVGPMKGTLAIVVGILGGITIAEGAVGY
jgi:hypothetical protein